MIEKNSFILIIIFFIYFIYILIFSIYYNTLLIFLIFELFSYVITINISKALVDVLNKNYIESKLYFYNLK